MIIAKFRDDDKPGFWLVTDFTMEQIESLLRNHEIEVERLKIVIEQQRRTIEQQDRRIRQSLEDKLNAKKVY